MEAINKTMKVTIVAKTIKTAKKIESALKQTSNTPYLKAI
jgi:hypothetical protein